MKQLLSIVLFSAIFASCVDGITGSGNIKTEKRNVESFQGIASKGSIGIEVFNGPDYTVEIEADDNVLEHIITEVKNGRLDVHYRHNMSFSNVHARAIVTGPSFDRFAVKGSGSITGKNPISQDKRISIILNGSGNISAEITGPEVEADLDGSGDINLTGKTRSLVAKLNGSGSMRCGNLKSETTTIELHGSGSATVFASVFLKAHTTGSGSIQYSGNPATTDVKDDGSGSITAK